jgi:hypothetical protein
MIDSIQIAIEFIGTGNFIGIVLFLISLFFGYFWYFKSYYRLVYNTEKICPRSKDLIDWSDDNEIFISRILLYNNGRKSLTQEEIKVLKIISSQEILDTQVLKGNCNLNSNQENKELNIEFDYLDNSEFILLEIKHKGKIQVEGRTSESGKILNTETKNWLIFNIITIAFVFVMMIYYVIQLLGNNFDNPLKGFLLFGMNMFFLIVLSASVRYVHKLFFIPDSVSSKYLSTKDKWNKEFQNNF